MDQIEASIALNSALAVGDQKETPGDSDQTKKPKEPSIADLQAKLDALEADNKKLKGQFEEVDFSNKYHSKKVAELTEELQKRAAAPANGNGDGKESKPAKSKIDELVREVAAEIGDPYQFIGSNKDEGEKGGEKLAKLIVSTADRIVREHGDPATDLQSQIDARVNSVLNGFLATLQVSEKYPELNDPKSEFSQRVGVETAKLQQDPEFSKLSPAKLTQVAAMQVKEAMLSEGHDFAEREAERDQKIRRASGGGGATKPSTESKKELDKIESFFAQRAGISPEEYREEADNIGMWPS